VGGRLLLRLFCSEKLGENKVSSQLSRQKNYLNRGYTLTNYGLVNENANFLFFIFHFSFFSPAGACAGVGTAVVSGEGTRF